MEKFYKIFRGYTNRINLRTRFLHLVFSFIILLLAISGFAQNKLFDEIKFSESEFNSKMVYVKWYSVGVKPAPDFLTMKYTDEKPVEINTIKMIYKVRDSTFYVMQDTLTVKSKSAIDEGMLQYFLVPHDTSGQVGNPTSIVLVSKVANRWFLSTKADKLKNEKGIKISWVFSEPKAIEHYSIQRSTNFNSDYEVIGSISTAETSYIDRVIKPDVVYYYRLMAIPVDGNKAIVSNVIFASGINPQPPLPPYISISKSHKGGAMLHIQVTDVEAAGVRVYRNNGDGGKLFPISNLLKVPDSLVVVYYDTADMLSGRKSYIYSARTESTSFIESAFADSVWVRPVISELPKTPDNLTAYTEDGQVKLFWENMEANDPAIAGYKLMRKVINPNASTSNSEFIPLSSEASLLKINYFTDTTAQPGKTYIYKVNSVDIDGNISRQGVIATVNMYAEEPIEPFGLEGYKVDGSIYLTWGQTIYRDISSVNLYRYQRNGKPILLSKLPADSTEYTDSDIKADNLYFYYLTTVNKAGVESTKSLEVGVE